MPQWLMMALAALGITVGGNIASGHPGDFGGQGIPFLPAAIDPFERGGFSFVGGRLEKRKRRRRRQALTQGDRNAIAFIAATISKVAAGAFAVQLVTRSR